MTIADIAYMAQDISRDPTRKGVASSLPMFIGLGPVAPRPDNNMGGLFGLNGRDYRAVEVIEVNDPINPLSIPIVKAIRI